VLLENMSFYILKGGIMKRVYALLTIAVVCLFAVSVMAHTPKHGLGDAAISPDGKILVTGGNNRVLYVLNPTDFKVVKRIWLKTNVHEMEFSSDGSTLMLEDTKEILHFYDTSNWKLINQVKQAGRFSAAPAVDLVAGFKPSSKLTRIFLLSMRDGKRRGVIEHAGYVKLVGLGPEGKRLVVLSDGPRNIEPKKSRPKRCVAWKEPSSSSATTAGPRCWLNTI
jgi:WD40 repeat protein